MDENGKSTKLGPGGWLALAVMTGLLAASLRYAADAWNAAAGVHMSGLGWTFLVLGAVATFALGAGLMALVFYSSRHGMDR